MGLTLLELIFVLQDRISGFYLVDAMIQMGLVAFWVYGWRKKERELAEAARPRRPPLLSRRLRPDLFRRCG